MEKEKKKEIVKKLDGISDISSRFTKCCCIAAVAGTLISVISSAVADTIINTKSRQD